MCPTVCAKKVKNIIGEKKLMSNPKYIIFSDLDGTLLDDIYSFEKAKPALKILKSKKIPLIFCSAKTKSEQLVIGDKMGISSPFIVENGSAIYIPVSELEQTQQAQKGQKNDKSDKSDKNTNSNKEFEIIVLGVKAEEIQKNIEKLRKRHYILNYGIMSAEEVAEVTGLTIENAKRAKDREFGETIVKADKTALKELAKTYNVVSGGRFTQVFGKGADKGMAVKILTEIYRNKFGDVISIGIGNGPNDEPMLNAVMQPVIVKNSDGSYSDIKLKKGVKLIKSDKKGPEGWAEVVKKLILAEYGL